MLHFLTVGFLDEEAIQRREIRAVATLPEEIFGLLQRHVVWTDGGPTMEGAGVVIEPTHIRCPWYALRRNRTAERFAARARAMFGCTVADVSCGRVVAPEDLE